MAILRWDPKDPDEVLDYDVDWTDHLDGDTISTSTWILPDSLTKISDSHTDSFTKIWLSGGIINTTVTLTNVIVTVGGRVLTQDIRLPIGSALIVENGTGIIGANSYASEADLLEYGYLRGLTIPDGGDIVSALIRATSYIDSYRARFPGYRTFRRNQGLEWPRTGAYYAPQNSGIYGNYYEQFSYDGYLTYSQYGDYIASNVIPPEIIKATCEAAIRELNRVGSLMPDNVVEASGGGALKKITAGDTSKEYAVGVLATRSSVPFPIIDDLLSVLLTTTGNFGIAVRG